MDFLMKCDWLKTTKQENNILFYVFIWRPKNYYKIEKADNFLEIMELAYYNKCNEIRYSYLIIFIKKVIEKNIRIW
jgi:hypothetical protein